MKAPKISSVQPLENKMLLVKFENGISKVYDCTQLLGMEMFQVLKSDAFFKAVRVDLGGYGISWNDEADLSEYELWVNGVESRFNQAMAKVADVEPPEYDRL